MSAKQDALARGTHRLAAAGIESSRLDTRILLAYAMGIAREDLLHASEPTEEQLGRFEDFLARREDWEPVAYITGHKEFWSLDFEVGPGVLVPRPDSETLVEEAQALFPDRNAPLDVLDLGTGSGCLLIAFLAEYPNATGLGIERSPEALRWAQKNVTRHRLADRCGLSQAHWNGGIEGRYDLVFCNPPYVATRELDAIKSLRREPRGALDGGEDGLDAYGALAPHLGAMLKPGGAALLEIGSMQAAAVQTVLKQDGFVTSKVARDLAGHDRCVIVTARGKRP